MKDESEKLSNETLAIEELYIQLRAMKKVLEEKGLMTEDEFRVAYARELVVSPGAAAGTKITDYLSNHRKKFLRS
ncbi:MAG: hypothetical protein HZB59_12635 [Ignavibacteriales bacterium]|nr:hypothetical protein [Ignavibacteriales bacterium]